MQRDFEIIDGIYLSQPPHEVDLHNNFVFLDLHYSIERRTVSLTWRRSKGEWVPPDTPPSVCVEFREVSEFRFRPRDPLLPFTEDDCLNTFGYWTDEEWANGAIIDECKEAPDPSWLAAIDFMSGAVIAVQAASAHARIEA
jgi:hypothetical protein